MYRSLHFIRFIKFVLQLCILSLRFNDSPHRRYGRISSTVEEEYELVCETLNISFSCKPFF